MRTVLLLALLALPGFALFPTAHACAAEPSTAAVPDTLYVVMRDHVQSAPVEVNGIGVGLEACWFRGRTIDTYRETNGIAGLQTADDGCRTPDQHVAHVFVVTNRMVTCIG